MTSSAAAATAAEGTAAAAAAGRTAVVGAAAAEKAAAAAAEETATAATAGSIATAGAAETAVAGRGWRGVAAVKPGVIKRLEACGRGVVGLTTRRAGVGTMAANVRAGGESPRATTTMAHSSTNTRGASGSGATRTTTTTTTTTATTATTLTATSAPSTTPSAAVVTTLGARLRGIEGGGGGVSGGEVDNGGAEFDLRVNDPLSHFGEASQGVCLSEGVKAGLVVRRKVEEQVMDLQGLGKGSLASGKAIGYLLHAPYIVDCTVAGGKGDGEVLMEQNADRADVATLEHRLEFGPNQVSAHLASLEAAHKGVEECTEEDGASAVVGSGPSDAVGDVSRHGGVVLRN
ncbi:unnamed protein product [Closterium sp. NIES-54]